MAPRSVIISEDPRWHADAE